MVCYMFKSNFRGCLLANSKQMTSKQLAKLCGETEEKIDELLNELEVNEVFSKLPDGTIYNRRMHRETERTREISKARSEAGKRGGEAKGKQIDSEQGSKREAKKPASTPTPSSTPTSTPTSSLKKEKTFSPTSDEVRLSELLFSKIQERDPKVKKPNIQKWGINIDRLIRIDKRTPGEIEKIIIFCQKDNFWKSNILSTEKLREKFSQLTQKKESYGSRNFGSSGETGKETGKARSDDQPYPVDETF